MQSSWCGASRDGIDTMNAVLEQKEFDMVFFTGWVKLEELSRRSAPNI